MATKHNMKEKQKRQVKSVPMQSEGGANTWKGERNYRKKRQYIPNYRKMKQVHK